MSFYAESATAALALLEKFGKTLTLSRDGGGTFDPVAGRYTAEDADSTEPVTGVILPLTKIDDNQYLEQLIQGKLRRVIIAAKGMALKPQAGDKVTDGSTIMEVIGSTPLNPAGTPLIHKINARVIA